MTRWMTALACGLVLLMNAGAAQAQAQRAVESKVWVVPVDGAQAMMIVPLGWVGVTHLRIINVGARNANVIVHRFPSVSVGPVEPERGLVVARGAMGGMSVYTKDGVTFAVVLSTEPVIVSAESARMAQPNIERNTPNSPPVGEVRDTNNVRRYEVGPWSMQTTVPAPSYAVDCDGAESGHFACGLMRAFRFPGVTAQLPDRAPTENEQASPPPREPEPRYTAVPRPSPTVQDRARPRPRGEFPR